MIRFRTVKDISLGFLFERKPMTSDGEPPVVIFSVAMATPMLGYDEKGNYSQSEMYQFLDDAGNTHDEFHDGAVIASGALYPHLMPEIHGDLNYYISFYNDASFERHQLIGFLEIMSSSFFDEVYNEFLQGHE